MSGYPWPYKLPRGTGVLAILTPSLLTRYRPSANVLVGLQSYAISSAWWLDGIQTVWVETARCTGQRENMREEIFWFGSSLL